MAMSPGRDNDATVPRGVTEVPAGILDQMARISALPAACPVDSERVTQSTTRMVLWAAPCAVFVVPLELGLARSLPFSAQTRDMDIRLPMRTEEPSRLGLHSPTGWHPSGGDAA